MHSPSLLQKLSTEFASLSTKFQLPHKELKYTKASCWIRADFMHFFCKKQFFKTSANYLYKNEVIYR